MKVRVSQSPAVVSHSVRSRPNLIVTNRTPAKIDNSHTKPQQSGSKPFIPNILSSYIRSTDAKDKASTSTRKAPNNPPLSVSSPHQGIPVKKDYETKPLPNPPPDSPRAEIRGHGSAITRPVAKIPSISQYTPSTGSQIRKPATFAPIPTSQSAGDLNSVANPNVNLRGVKFICASCNQPLKGVCVSTSTGQKFHQTCLKCAGCGGPIAGLFAQKHGAYYCATCTDSNLITAKSTQSGPLNAST